MTTVTVQPGGGVVQRASLLVLSAGLLVSAAINFGWIVGAGAYLGGGYASRVAQGRTIELSEDAVQMAPPPPREIPLGRQDAKQAAITWLGVVEDPIEGDAPESEVEQAAFTTRAGDAAQTAAASPGIDPLPGSAPAAEVETQRESVESSQPESALAPEQQSSVLVDDLPLEVEPAPVQEVEATPGDDPRVLPASPIEQDAKAEDAEQQPTAVEPETDLPPGPSLVSEEPERVEEDAPPIEDPETAPEEAPPPEAMMGPTLPVETAPAEAGSDGAPQSAPVTAGKRGVVSDRESTASIIKRAIPVKVKDLNQPIAGRGLEIITVDPKFPASVRFTQLPRNPVVLIRFNAAGKVAHVSFLRDEEKKKVYDTGSRAVDEPLLNAIYQWRAKGEQLKQLDAADTESTLEISMTIIFRDEGSDP